MSSICRSLVVGFAIVAAAAPAAEAAGGTFAVTCPFAKFEQIDPIFAFGRQSDHLHLFKGNKHVNSTSTYSSLRATPHDGTTCYRNTDTDKPGSGDLSSYWAPTLVRHNLDGAEDLVPVVSHATYYGGKHHDPAQIQPVPAGLKMLAGDPNAASVQDPQKVRLSCHHGGLLVRYSGGGLQCVDTNLADGKAPGIRLSVRFPSCWNGEAPSDADTSGDRSRTNYDDTAKMRYAVSVNNNKSSPWTCPASHPIPVPELFLIISWTTAGGPNVHLSNHNEYGEHADFFNGWDPVVMEKLVENCIRVRGANCGHGDKPTQ